MFVIKIPIAEYLERAFTAAEETDYAGIVLAIGREADSGQLISSVMASWSSLHSVTREHFAVISPDASKGSHMTTVANPGVEPEALGAPGIETAMVDDREWDRAFWRALPVKRGQDPLQVGAAISERRPSTKRAGVKAVTSTVNEMAKFLGLSESLIPCVAVASMWEKRILVLPTSSQFDIYPFLKSAIETFEEEATAVDDIRRELRAAQDDFARESYAASKEVRSRKRRVDNMRADWLKQETSLLGELRLTVAPKVEPLMEELQAALNNCRQAPEPALRVLAEVKCAISELPNDRLHRKIESATRKVREGFAEEGEARERLAVAEEELRKIGRTYENVRILRHLYEEARAAVSLSSHVRAAAPVVGIRTVKGKALGSTPWATEILQRQVDKVVSIPLKRQME
ncbi:hypothetical protein [Streptomyces endophytica]|uniref:Uncharacterized protein n=1 Tax=Streptomyces endophytica TaxID=2991496 RepID=A0ABY6PJ96_9ACTN|nr:hypothetical protein [Streptomyces endophytica]UZJ33500.1 hypothetical protein OJ254_28510 [Streptomyces endophytica]